MTSNGEQLKQWPYSVKIEMNAKGFIQVSVHTYDDTGVDACDQALTSLNYVVEELRKLHYKVASDYADEPKKVFTKEVK